MEYKDTIAQASTSPILEGLIAKEDLPITVEYAYLDNIGKPGAKPNEYVQPKPEKKKSFWEKIMPWK